MAGMSSNGLIVIPDYWSDSFFINPAYAAQNEGLFDRFMLNNTLAFNFNYTGQKQKVSNLETTVKNYELTFNDNIEAIISIKRIMLGFKFNFYGNYSSRYNKQMITDYTISQNNYNLLSAILFSAQLNEFADFGFDAGVNVNLFNETGISGKFNNLQIDIKGKTPLYISGNGKAGFLFKIDKLKMSVSIPFAITYFQNHPALYSLYNAYVSEWEKRTDSILTGFKAYFLFDIALSSRFSFRIPFSVSFAYNYLTRIYNADKSVFTSLTGDEHYELSKFTLESLSSFSFIGKFSEKIMMHLGFDIKLEFGFTEGSYTEYRNSLNIEGTDIDAAFGSFIGGEFFINDKITLRCGASSNIFNYYYDKYINIDQLSSSVINKNSGFHSSQTSNSNDKYDFTDDFMFFLNKLSFNSGMTISPVNFFSIELTLYFIFTDILNQRYSQNSSNNANDMEYNNVNADIKFNFGMIFKL